MVPSRHVLVIGATGSIGRLVVDEALRQGHQVRALVRDPRRASRLPAAVQQVVGDLTQPTTLRAAVAGINAIVFTHGADGAGKTGAEQVSYGGVRNVLLALQGQVARIALMTAIGITHHDSAYNRSTHTHDWKRRSERLLRASRLPYTIVRPGWFDYHRPDQLRLTLLQGDTRHAGDPSDGVVARAQIAQVLVHSLTSDHAVGKTFELVAERGPAPQDLDALLARLEPDALATLDGVRDNPGLPLAQEPTPVRADLLAMAPRITPA